MHAYNADASCVMAATIEGSMCLKLSSLGGFKLRDYLVFYFCGFFGDNDLDDP